MRRYYVACLIIIVFNSCSVKIKSAVDTSVPYSSFTNMLIVIPYQNGETNFFTTTLKHKINEKFRNDGRKVEILPVCNSTHGPAVLAEKTAKIIYEKLIIDKIL